MIFYNIDLHDGVYNMNNLDYQNWSKMGPNIRGLHCIVQTCGLQTSCVPYEKDASLIRSMFLSISFGFTL